MNRARPHSVKAASVHLARGAALSAHKGDEEANKGISVPLTSSDDVCKIMF